MIVYPKQNAFRIFAVVCAIPLFAISPALGQTSSPVPAASPAATPTPKPRTPTDAVTPKAFKPYRHQGFMKRKAEGPIGILFLGDSITDGWPRKGADTWGKFAAANPADFGISAMRTEGLLWNITNGELDGISPKATIILIGVNNIIQCPDENPEWVAAGIQKIVETVHQKIPSTKVILMAIFPARNPATHPARARIAEVNRLIEKLADGDKTRFLDIGKQFLNPDGSIRKDLLPDGLHPNAKGYKIWSDAMAPILKDICPEAVAAPQN